MTVTVLGGALSLLAVSCGGDSEEAEDRPRPTTTERETTTTLDPEEVARQEVIAAREAADEAWIEGWAPPTPNPDDPVLEETHTGLMLDRVKDTAEGLQRNGFAVRLPADSQHRLEVESVRFQNIEGKEVALLDVCTVDDSERIVVSTGEVLASGVTTTKAAEAMQKVDGVWKLAERREDDQQEGVVGCAVD
jgi:hypothetical protein